MKNVNVVLEGEYKGRSVLAFPSQNTVTISGAAYPFTQKWIASYAVIDETNKDQYSFWKGALGVALLGGFGAIAGVRGKKKKEYLIAINWKDGKKSLICIDDECYKTFVRSMF